MQVSTSNKPDYSTAQDKPINIRQNNNEPINKRLTGNDFPIEKNTNPEIEKIEQEILTILKRLGGNDEEDSVSYDDGGSGGSGDVGVIEGTDIVDVYIDPTVEGEGDIVSGIGIELFSELFGLGIVLGLASIVSESVIR
jgi:hypothetical protein